MKVVQSICQKIWKTKQRLQDWKKSVFIPIPKEDNAKKCSNYCTIAFISHANKILLKILQARLHQYVNGELPHVRAGFRNGRDIRDQVADKIGSQKKAESCEEVSTSPLLTMLKPLTVWITTDCGKFFKRGDYQTTFMPPEKSV